jgi:hypothetical protein
MGNACSTKTLPRHLRQKRRKHSASASNSQGEDLAESRRFASENDNLTPINFDSEGEAAKYTTKNLQTNKNVRQPRESMGDPSKSRNSGTSRPNSGSGRFINCSKIPTGKVFKGSKATEKAQAEETMKPAFPKVLIKFLLSYS